MVTELESGGTRTWASLSHCREDIDACHGLRDEIGASADHLLSKDIRACVGTKVGATGPFPQGAQGLMGETARQPVQAIVSISQNRQAQGVWDPGGGILT